MPTPAEQKALAFVALVILLGGAVRIGGGGDDFAARPTAAEREALALQALAADSAAERAHSRRRAPRGKSKGKTRNSDDDDAMMAGRGSPQPPLNVLGFPPPAPRIDTYRPQRSSSGGVAADRGARAPAGPRSAGEPVAPIDVDRGSAAELEALPYVGPALAGRIVASRDSLGPFGSLEGLGRVRGIGPATLRRLAPFVTFSGQTRR